MFTVTVEVSLDPIEYSSSGRLPSARPPEPSQQLPLDPAPSLAPWSCAWYRMPPPRVPLASSPSRHHHVVQASLHFADEALFVGEEAMEPVVQLEPKDRAAHLARSLKVVRVGWKPRLLAQRNRPTDVEAVRHHQIPSAEHTVDVLAVAGQHVQLHVRFKGRVLVVVRIEPPLPDGGWVTRRPPAGPATSLPRRAGRCAHPPPCRAG